MKTKLLGTIVVLILLVLGLGFIYLATTFSSQPTSVTPISTSCCVSTSNQFTNPLWVYYPDESLIKSDFQNIPNSDYYSKYIAYVASNGKPIYILAQDKITNEQLLRAYNILSFYLESLNNSQVTNSIANSGFVINMPNGADGASTIPLEAVTGQPLYQLEVPTEGSKWYVENDYTHRDAAYEEILHFVHDNGIGTESNPRTLPELQAKILKATKNALPENMDDWGKTGLWGLNARDWLLELAAEGSLEQEYLAAVVDSYYGLWGANTESEGGMWGTYIAKTREDIEQKDIQGFNLVKSIFPEYLTYMARISSEFEGNFTMYFDPNIPYTHKSQYLVNARLLGTKDSNLIGNSQNNSFIGNAGNNLFDGKSGTDVVQFNGFSSNYTIEYIDGKIRISDKRNLDGINTLVNIEILRFQDKDINAITL